MNGFMTHRGAAAYRPGGAMRRCCVARWLALAGAWAGAGLAGAQVPADFKPPEFEGVGITEHLGQSLPMDLAFTDERGQAVTLGDYFKTGRPVILTPVYFQCPMLCNLTLNGLVGAMNDLEWSAGNEFEIVTLSFNHREGPQLAEVKKRAYLTQYPRQSAGAGWHFLTGDQRNIEALMKSIGFGYRYDPKTGEYLHTSTIVFVTPDGRISRYMNNVMFQPRDVRLALIEASQGAIGSPMDKFLLFMCYRYDPDSHSYAASAVKIMRLGGALTVVLMLTGFLVLWLRSSGGHGHAAAPGQSNQSSAPIDSDVPQS